MDMSISFLFFFLISFGVCCWAWGNLILVIFLRGNHGISPLAYSLLSFVAGNVAFSYALTFLGFYGLFIPSFLWLILIGSIILAIFQFFKKIITKKFVLTEIPSSKNNLNYKSQKLSKGLLILGFIIFGFFIVPAILQSMAPPYMRDSLVYHLLCPKEYLRAGRLLHIEGNLYSAFPKGHEVLMTFLLATAGERAAQGFSILQNIAVFITLFLIIRSLTSSSSAMISTLGYATLPPVIYFSGCGYVEPALTLALGGSLLALLSLLNSPHKNKELENNESAFVGFLAGWMPAVKYTGIIYLFLIATLILWHYRKEKFNETAKMIGVFLLAASPGLCWLIWNWISLGNPFYPFAYSIFGGKGWDEVRDRAMYIYFQMFGMGKEIGDYLLLPWRFSFLGRFDTIFFDGAMGPFLIIFIGLSIFSAFRRLLRLEEPKVLEGVGLVLLISASLFILGSQQARFWLPSQFLLCIYAAPIVDLINKWSRGKFLTRLAIGLIILFCLIWNGWFVSRQMMTIGYYKPALKMEKERTFLKRVIPGYSAIEFINHNISSSSRVLCIWTGAYGYYLNRPYYSDTLIEDISIKEFIDESKDWKNLKEKLLERGFTHIFMRSSLTENNMSAAQLAIFKSFLQNGTKEVYRDRDFVVLEIYL